LESGLIGCAKPKPEPEAARRLAICARTIPAAPEAVAPIAGPLIAK
jgi:hypothetical protein